MDAASNSYGGNMTVLDMIDRAFRIYRENVVPFLAITALVTVPIALISIPLAIQQQRDPFGDTTALIQIVAGLVNLIAVIVQIVIVQTMVTHMASELFLGRKTTLAEAWHSSKARFSAVGVGYILYLVAVIGVALLSGVLLLCYVGIIGLIFVFYFGTAVNNFLLPVLALENVNGVQGLNRAWYLGRRRFWRGLGLITLVSLITITFFLSLVLIAELFYNPLLSAGYADLVAALRTVVQNVVTIFITPLQFIALTVFYYDTRVRLEGLDVSFYLSKHSDPRPAQIPSPKPGGFFNGQDALNLLAIAGGITALFLVSGAIVYVALASLGLA